MIPGHIIEEIRARADLVEIVGESVQLRKRGRNFLGLCPFHPEKTPSFTVTPEKQMYYCFGCQAGGNVFTFVMAIERLDFPDALRALAERTGVEVPAATESASDPHAPLRAANGLAAAFYHRRLLEGEDAAPARAYLAARGIEPSAWEAFRLGWAPEAWDALTGEAARQGISADVLSAAGLAGRSDRTGGIYDRFRGRLCFPIRALGGDVVALSGRRLDDEEPKYLNSADTPIYAKGRVLFHLDAARGAIRRAGAAVVVEGNFDVVTLHQAGFRNVVAPLGTAFTPEQARLLRRYTRTAYLANDGDPAGTKSAFRSADVLLAAGFAVRIVRLPAGEDPDSVVRQGGAGAFEGALQASADVIDAKLALIRERVDLGDVMKKRRAIRRLLDTIARVPDPVTRSLYTDRVAAELNVPRETLVVPAPDAAPARGPQSPLAPPRRSPADAPRGVDPPEIQDERYVLLHALSDPRWREEALAVCRPVFFTVAAYARVFERLQAARAEGADERTVHWDGDAAVQGVLAELEVWRAEQGFPLSEGAFRDSLQQLQLKALARGVLEDEVPTGERLVDALRRRDLQREIERGRLRPGGTRGQPGGDI